MMKTLFTFFALFGIIYFVGKAILGSQGDVDKGNNKRIANVAFWNAIILLVVRNFWGLKSPGSFLERADYTEKLMLNVYPDGDKEINSRHVPGLVRASLTGEDMSYGVSTIWLPGRRLDMEGQKFNGQRGTAFDVNGGLWNVAITDEKAE